MPERTLPGRLAEVAAAAPDRETLRIVRPAAPDTVLTRAAFFDAARRAGERIAAAGAGPGDLVIFVLSDLVSLTAGFFGASLAGAIPSIMPFQTEKLHPDRYQAATAALLEIARPAVLVTEAGLEAQVRALLPESGSLPNLLVLDSAGLLGADEPPALEASFDPEATALLQHSSGTTGLQKGVALSHRAIFEQLERYSGVLGFTPDDVVVSWLPLYHDMGLIAGFLMPLLSGARLVLMSPLDWVRAPQMLLEAISTHRGTFCWLPNFAYNFLADKVRPDALDGVDLGSIRAFVNCSEPVYDSSHRAFLARFAPHGVEESMLTASYAMAEAVLAVTQTEVGRPAPVDVVDRSALQSLGEARPTADEPRARAVVSSGRPIPGMEVRVLGPEREPLPERRVGELAIRSSHLLTEYHRRPAATAEAFHDGWFLTGDMGYMAGGEVFVLGRKKDVIIVGGRNIYPRDLETLVNRVEGVYPGRTVAFGVSNPQRGTEDVAVVAEMAHEMDEDARREVTANIRRAVAAGTDIMVRYVELVPRNWLIKTSSGKVARAANREQFFEMHPEARGEG